MPPLPQIVILVAMNKRYGIRTKAALLDGALTEATIIIGGEIIEEILPYQSLPENLDSLLDLGSQWVLPGLLDIHVHLNEPGRTDWEGFETGTKAAAAGGITTVVDMPLNSSPVTTTVEALETKLDAARGKLYADCGFYGGLVPGNVHQIEPLIQAGVLGIKAFLCHSGIDEFPNATEKELRAAMPILARYNIPLLVHAELPDEGAPQWAGSKECYQSWLKSRPDRFELDAIALLIKLCRETGCPVHIVHLATAQALPMLGKARKEGLPITVETAPHYLSFCAEEIADGDCRFKCAPPIRSRQNRDDLRKALQDGLIDLVATDHSPAPPDLKNLESRNLQGAWGGISSLQLLLPATAFAMESFDKSPEALDRWLRQNPQRILGLPETSLSAKAPATFIVYDPEKTTEVSAENLYHRHKATPYEGYSLKGSVQATYLRGEQIYDLNKGPLLAKGRPLLNHYARAKNEQ